MPLYGIFMAFFNFLKNNYKLNMAKKKEYKKQTALSVDINLIEIMDEYLKEIGYENRSKYIEKLILEDLEKRNIKIDKNF